MWVSLSLSAGCSRPFWNNKKGAMGDVMWRAPQIDHWNRYRWYVMAVLLRWRRRRLRPEPDETNNNKLLSIKEKKKKGVSQLSTKKKKRNERNETFFVDCLLEELGLTNLGFGISTLKTPTSLCIPHPPSSYRHHHHRMGKETASEKYDFSLS